MFTLAEPRAETDGTDRVTEGIVRLTVVTGRFTRPLGAGAGEVKRVPLDLGIVRGVMLGKDGRVTVEPRKLDPRLYVAA